MSMPAKGRGRMAAGRANKRLSFKDLGHLQGLGSLSRAQGFVR